jgi:riboflavin kinase / FMN adenylyltransferase
MLITKRLNGFGRRHPRSIVAFGVFDGLHLGHQALVRSLVRRARRAGADSVVLTFDPHPRTVLARRPWPMVLTTLREKERLLAELGVDIAGVIRFTSATARLGPAAFVERILHRALAAATVICGADCGFGHGRSGDLGLLGRLGERFGFAVVPLQPRSLSGATISSTAIRRALLAGDLASANRMLGRPYRLSGTVVAGSGIGRVLGYRTANLRLANRMKLVPANGVYAAVAEIAGHRYPGMLYIGSRPTFRNGGERRIEFHAFGVNANWYRRQAVIDLVRYIRPDRAFASAGALARQIARDEQAVRRALGSRGIRSQRRHIAIDSPARA